MTPAPPEAGDPAPGFEALCCDGETFRSRTLAASLADRGGVLIFGGFVFSAIATNWWERYERYGWHEFDVPVYGVYRDGPYGINAFLREREIPFEFFSDVNADVADAYGLLTERDGMAGTRTSRRAVFVLDGDATVVEAWSTDEWIHPVPTRELGAVIESL